MTALNFLKDHVGLEAINLGMWIPGSVFDLVFSFEKASAKKIEKIIVKRRPADLPIYFTKLNKAADILSWKARLTSNQMRQSV